MYFLPDDVATLRSQRSSPGHSWIWENVKRSADWCLTLKPRRKWIAPESVDPVYENLYDRFYGIMRDVAVTEHLSLAHAVGGLEEHGDAARTWLLATTHSWANEAKVEVDASKAYSVSRLMKGLAVGYDVLHGLLSERERNEVKSLVSELSRAYYAGYFSKPDVAGWRAAPHHDIVEWASFGVCALAVLGEVPGAEEWVEAVCSKFREQLLPRGLASDGAQVEGATFWASTMQYRIFFMDALRRTTGLDLFAEYGKIMMAEPALASIAGQRVNGLSTAGETVLLQPSYGQIEYIAPVLLFLAREYRRPICQHLALWDRSLGNIQRTRYVTPNGEELLFELGGYAYIWYDPSVRGDYQKEPLSFSFPSVGEAYMRASWLPGGLVVAVRENALAIHGGGRLVLMANEAPSVGLRLVRMEDDGENGTILMECWRGNVEVTLHRPNRVVVRRSIDGDWSFWCHGSPEVAQDRLAWVNVELVVTEGVLSRWEPRGYVPAHAVGHGKLSLRTPEAEAYPKATLRPSQVAAITLEVMHESSVEP